MLALVTVVHLAAPRKGLYKRTTCLYNCYARVGVGFAAFKLSCYLPHAGLKLFAALTIYDHLAQNETTRDR